VFFSAALRQQSDAPSWQLPFDSFAEPALAERAARRAVMHENFSSTKMFSI
jgi:hypothetical protein